MEPYKENVLDIDSRFISMVYICIYHGFIEVKLTVLWDSGSMLEVEIVTYDLVPEACDNADVRSWIKKFKWRLWMEHDIAISFYYGKCHQDKEWTLKNLSRLDKLNFLCNKEVNMFLWYVADWGWDLR